jgi:hypothetical protein
MRTCRRAPRAPPANWSLGGSRCSWGPMRARSGASSSMRSSLTDCATWKRTHTKPTTSHSDEKSAHRDTKVWHGRKWSLNDGQIQNPSAQGYIAARSTIVPRGFVHYSIAILYHEVPNPNITIRNFSIAVRQRRLPVQPRTALKLGRLSKPSKFGIFPPCALLSRVQHRKPTSSASRVLPESTISCSTVV